MEENKTIGVKSVNCTCGSLMKRKGSQFEGSITFVTYYCSRCHKAVNVVDLDAEYIKKIEEYNGK